MSKISVLCFMMAALFTGWFAYPNSESVVIVESEKQAENVQEYDFSLEDNDISSNFNIILDDAHKQENTVRYYPLNVPDINSSFKAYMDARKITNKASRQYKYISNNAWVDNQGFLRADADKGIPQDYYLIALGSYYGTDIGTKYRITTDIGKVFYGVLADCKSDVHTNSTNQYTTVGTPNIVEFLVNTDRLNRRVKYHGSANAYEPLQGNIVKIERIEV